MLVNDQFEVIRHQPFEAEEDITRYFNAFA